MARRIADKRPILEAMGLELQSLTQQAFSNASLRPLPWPARKKPAPHQLLRKTGTLMRSNRVVEVTHDKVTVGSDRVYAAHQQFGSRKSSGRGSGVPARPFFPFASATGPMMPMAKQRLERIALAKMKSLLE